MVLDVHHADHPQYSNAYFQEVEPVIARDEADVTASTENYLWKMLCVTTVVTFAILVLKLKAWEGIDFGLLMWAEDGVIFLKGAVEHGVASLFTPYAGYFHAYPRLIALLGTGIELHHAPVVFFLGWCLALMGLAWTCARKFADAKLGLGVAAAVVTLMLVQPNDGEIFYSLTNAQWFLGVALTLYLFLPGGRELNRLEYAFIFLMALTGPFVCVLFPIWCAKEWFSKSPRLWKLFAILLIAFTVQAACYLLSDRASSGKMSTSWSEWFRPIVLFFGLGQRSSAMWFALVFWVLLLAALAMAWARSKVKKNDDVLVSIWLLIAAAGMFAAGLVAARADPSAIGPMGGASRYYFIPYCLIYLAAIFSVGFSRRLQWGMIGLIFLLVLSAWSGRSDIFFAKMGRVNVGIIPALYLAEKSPSAMIPVSPSPDWSFELKKR